MTQVSKLRETIRRRLDDEVGRIVKQAPFTVALAYPSPYAVAMSSLGFQRIYRAIMETPGLACERAFLSDDDADPGIPEERPLTYESRTPLDQFPVVAVSVAYELEIAGLVRLLDAARIPVRRTERTDSHPFLLAGGPLTFSNPLPLSPIADAVVLGEAEGLVPEVLAVLEAIRARGARLDALAAMPGVFVPERHGSRLGEIAKADDALLPAWGPIRTPHTVLADMFLIETERGCSRACTYCVMRRSTNGGMRVVPMDTILGLVPRDAKRVGLVGAAVSDHPNIAQIVRTLAEEGKEVGLSSLRPDRLSEEFVAALRQAGTRTLTTAMDGASERLRESLERKARERHLVRCAELARRHGMERLKLYLMIGLPGETDADVDECVRFTTELSRVVPISLGIAPFCPKRNTPLYGSAFAGIEVIQRRLDRLKRGLQGRALVHSTSAKWAWVEHVLAQGGEAEGLAVIDAVRRGGRFDAYRKAFPAPVSPRTHAPSARTRLALVVD
jgi:radical SAM superfamily enzyme YgiQ (UPF0313 family)